MQTVTKLDKTWTALTIILFTMIALTMYWNGYNGEDILRVLALMFVMIFFVLGSAFWVVFPFWALIKFFKKEK